MISTQVAAALAEGRLAEKDVPVDQIDLVPVPGWTASLEFLRDSWFVGSEKKSWPVVREISGDAA